MVKNMTRKGIRCYRVIYAAYGDHGEEYLASGTAEEIAEYLGISRSTVLSMACRSKTDLSNASVQVFRIGVELVPFGERMLEAIRKAYDSPVRDRKPDAWVRGYDCALMLMMEAVRDFSKQDAEQEEAERKEAEDLLGL